MLRWLGLLHVLLACAPPCSSALLSRRGLPFSDIIDQITGATDNVTRKALDVPNQIVDDLVCQGDNCEQVPHIHHKPLMDKINVLRTRLCWQRPQLKHHEDCMRFLGLKCSEESTGMGICADFEEFTEKVCSSEADPLLKALSCDLVEELKRSRGIKVQGGAERDQDGHISVSDHDQDGHTGGMDRDQDGYNDEVDAFPDDPQEWKDTDGDGIGDNRDPDRDGDTFPNRVDVFPDDPKEWSDIDGDGIGDNADNDRDGDGYENVADAFPNDPDEWADFDKDGKGDNSDDNRDGDPRRNEVDKFPDDQKEWLDSDGDGFGDNVDAYPYNRYCHSATEPCTRLDEESKGLPPSSDPVNLDKTKKPLPSQGYNEVARGPPVAHNNYYTWTGDWQGEFPTKTEPDRASIDKICKEHPKNAWCKHHKIHG